MFSSRAAIVALSFSLLALAPGRALAAYTNFEASHVHPIALTPSGERLLAVNTPDAVLEVFTIKPDGSLASGVAIPVGLEPVTVRARTNTEAWVVNHLSDSVSIVDLSLGMVVKTLVVGDEPTDVTFTPTRAFVAVSQEDKVKVYSLANLDLAPAVVSLFSRDVRALAVSPDATRVYAVTLRSGNRTTVVNANIVFDNDAGLNASRLAALGLNPMTCASPPPSYPPLPSGIVRNPALVDPPSGVPEVGLIVKWNAVTARWEDETGAHWNDCLPVRLPDHDLFVIDAATLAVTTVNHLGTSLFEVSVNPANGKVYVPHTEARNFVRFEHALGVRGHVVDNRIAIVDPSSAYSVATLDLNTHIDRGSDPATNLAERQASVSQPGMMVWKADGSTAYLTAIGSRKLFKLDGACLAGACLFGPNRVTPDAVEVGEGPTGVALHEGVGRAYVLNRFANSIAVVETGSLTKVAEVALHDPSPGTVRTGRRLLYDGIDSSGHGDAACSSCHLSGDMDGLAWDLGDPTGDFAPYTNLDDNVRFIIPLGNQPTECSPALCASHDGFDPQKGPMATQTLRGMLEPLHWRGDRPTMNDFNAAFVGLMGKEDIGPVNGKPAGLIPSNMELFRQFALGIAFPPNPNRIVPSTTAGDEVPSITFAIPETPMSGNPRTGQTLFDTHASDAGQTCAACHAHPFGAAGGQEGGVTPAEPTSAAATALFPGAPDGSRHSDLEVAHLRNMYEKFGPTFGTALSPAQRRTGFGYIHDGSTPDLGTFFAASVFNLTAQQARDIAAFMFFFPTGTHPAVGQQLTLAAGPPLSTPALLTRLLAVGDRADPTRHCELTATALGSGRMRAYRLEGGLWTTDVAGEPPVTTDALRTNAGGPITFLCAPLGSGARLGGDRDEDATLNGDDCNAADTGSWGPASDVSNLDLATGVPTLLTWDAQRGSTGPGLRYDAAGGLFSALRAAGLDPATSCLEGDLAVATYDDVQPDPHSGDGYYYLVRARNSCASPGFGPGRSALDDLECP